MGDWKSVDSDEHDEKWVHEEGHQLVVKEVTTKLLKPEQREVVNYDVQLWVDDGEDAFVLGGVCDESIEDAKRVAERILDL